MQVAAYGMAHNLHCRTHIKKGVILLVTREGEFKRIIIEGEEWDMYYERFCERLSDFIATDRDVKHREYKWAQLRYDEIEKTIKKIK